MQSSAAIVAGRSDLIGHSGTSNQNPTVAIGNVGGMNHGLKQEAYGIDEDVTLLAFDLLARVVAARVDAAPPFSAPLTLWLSMMQAVGLASRSTASRHFT